MNRIFRIIWSQALNTWIVASEIATRRGKRGGSGEVDETSRLSLPTRAGLIAALLCGAIAPAHAADLYWDINGNTAGLGGVGTWDTTTTLWNTSSTGTGGTLSSWNNANLDRALFNGTAGTVTLGTPITVSGLSFGTTGYTLTGSTLTLGGATPTITVNAGLTDTISAIIAGSAGLAKAGTGTLTLSGVNTFTGGINVTAGTLSVNGNTSLGDANNGITMAAGTTLNASSGSNFASTHVVTLSGGTVTLSGTRAGPARFTGAGGITTSGSATLSNDANDYTGQTVFGGTGGTVSFSSIADVGGGASALGAPTTVGNGTILLNNTSGSETMTYTGTGHSSNRNWSLASTGSSAFRLRNAGTGTLTLTGSIAITQTNNVNVFFDANGGDLVLPGVISWSATPGAINFTSTAGRTITLGNVNTYIGGTVISNATVRAGVLADKGVASSLGTSSGTTANTNINTNGILSYTGAGASSNRTWFFTSGPGTLSNDGTGALTLSGATTLSGAATLAGSYSGTANSISGVISGAGSLTVNSAGAWDLSGTNTYTGATTVSAGTLRAGAAAGGQAFGLNSALTLSNVAGATVDLNGFNQTIGSLAGGGTTGGDVMLGAGTLTTGGNNANTSYAGVISGTGGLIKNGTGVQSQSGINTYTGATTINAGTLQAGATAGGQAFGNGSAVSLVNVAGATLDLNSFDQTVGSLAGGGATGGNVLLGTGTLTTGGNNGNTSYAGVIGGTGGLTKAGSGVQTLSGTNTYTGATTVNAGTLQAGAAAGGQAFGNLSAVTLADAAGATLDLNGFDQTVGSLAGGGATGGNVTLGSAILTTGGNNASTSYAGAISGSGGMTKTGTGTMTLTSAANSVGATTVNAGTLDIDGVLTTGTVTMGNGILNVDGTVQASGATQTTLANTAGTASTVTIGSGGALLASGDLGDGSDTLDVSGTLNTGGGAVALGDGDDTLTIHDGTNIIGTVVAGAGTDTFNTNIATIANVGAVQGFETLSKTGAGTLNVNGPTSSDFTTVNVLAGLLDVNAAGSLTGVSTAIVASGATLNVNGSFGFTTGADSLTVAGSVTGLSTIDLLDGDDSFTIQDGADLSGLATAVNGGLGGDTLTADIAGTSILGGAVGFETLIKSNTGTLNINGPANSVFDTVRVQGGTLHVAAGVIVDPQTTVVSSGATMTVDGTYQGTAGADTFTVSGTVNGTGTIDLLGDDDVLTLNDGADLSGLANPLDGGAQGAGDTVVLNNAGAMTFSGSNITNFENLQKTNTGSATLTGTSTFSGGTALSAGTLDVDGTLNTSAVTMSDATTLNVDGTLQNTGATQTSITGSAGSNTVSVGAGGTLLATGDLGDGGDTLDVAGTLNTGGGAVALGNGDDTLTIHDGTNIIGTVVAGAGTDTFNTNIATNADVGAVQGFETLSKTGAGTLNVNGPTSSDFTTVNVLAGTLSINAAGSLTGVSTATVGSGATLNVDGNLGFTTGADTLTVAGTVAGSATVNLLDGDDQLTLQDGANLGGLANAIDGGLGNDTLTADIAGTAVMGSTVNFETLIKSNVGTLNVNGPAASTFTTVNVNGGTLDVNSTLETPTLTLTDNATLNVDGSVQGVGGTMAAISGTTGSNTVVVGASGTLLASGDLGDGSDTLDVAGTLNTGGGALNLGAGDDTFVIHDATNVAGTVIGGAGQDTRIYDIAGIANVGALSEFEGLTKRGAGAMNLTGPGVSDLADVRVEQGTLNVQAGASVGAPAAGSLNTLVAAGATLNVAGSYVTSTNADTFDVSGTIAGGGAINLNGGDDNLVVHDTANLSGLANAIDGGAGNDTVTADITGSATLGGAINFETLTKTNTGTLLVAGPVPSTFTTVNVAGGTLDVGVAGSIAGVTSTTVASGATLTANGSYSGSSAADTMTVSGTIAGVGTISLADGDDTLTLNDGAVLNNVIDGGAHGTGDAVVLNNAGAFAFNSASVVNFESLQKTNTGIATLTGTSTFSNGVAINAGALDVDGTFNVSTVTMSDATTLNVDGTLQNVGPTQTLIAGSAGSNTLSIGATGTLLARGDLGAGADVLDVFGTLDTGAGALNLGDGDDSFVVHDGAVALGTVDGGAGLDSRVYDINLNANLGALVNFEGVTKTGTGTLNINGPSATNLQQANVLGGTLSIGAGASVIATAGGSLDTVVASGATLNVAGSYGCGAGNDTMTVSGRVSGSGTVDLCGGDDTLTLNDGAVLNNVIDGGAHGAGDTVVLNNNNAMTLDTGSAINFEILQKAGVGILTLTGNQAYDTTLIDAGTATIAAGGTLTSKATTIAVGATLNVQGNFSGTSGDDSFTSRGNVTGALSFAAGNDTVVFIGGDISGLTGVDGGAGGNDRLSFSGLSFDGGDFAMTGWERVELLNDSTLTVGGPLAFGGGVLAIDATSRLDANAGASIGGSVENAGLINVGANRLAISGGYQGNNGALQLLVSPAGATSGGLDIAGDVTGTTRVTFASDGTDVPQQQAVSIPVISSVNDNLATSGGFTAASTTDGHVRLAGSISPWDFAQHADKNWYLDAVAGILPETAGYAVLPSIGQANIQNTDRLLFQRMDSVRGDDSQRCRADGSKQAGVVSGECQGAWMAVTGSDLEMGADPGFEFSGDSVGTFVGLDGVLPDSQSSRAGFFIGFQHGNYWTTGVNSTDLPGTGKSNVQIDTPTFGAYGSFNGRGGSYADVSLVAQIPKATIAVNDGFHQEVSGHSLTLSTQMGNRFAVGSGWSVEPQVQLSASATEWGNAQVDAGGKELVFHNDVLGTARASVHAEKMFETAGGARIRPWSTIGLQDTFGENQDAFKIRLPGSNAGSQAFPSHDLGLTATLDVGVEAQMSESASLFGVVSYGESLRGSESEQLQANVGVRIRW